MLKNNVSEVSYTWILQSGYPVITVSRDSGTNVKVKQKLFLVEPDRPLQEWYETPYK